MTTPRRPNTLLLWVVLGPLALVLSCAASGGHPATTKPAVTVPDFLVVRLGASTSAREFRGRPFHQSARSLDNAEFLRFGKGAVSFNEQMTAAEGVGPTLNENSCLSCHLDGIRGVDKPADLPGPGLLLRLSVPGETATGAPRPDPIYGGQLQTDAISGARREGTLAVTWAKVEGNYPDGTHFELRAPTFVVIDPAAGPLSPETMTSPRVAPPIIGLGLLEAIPEAEIRAGADPDDRNHDGVSGRVNTVWDNLTKSPMLGRFGWKAGQATVRQQSAGALHDDMGVTSVEFPDPCSGQGSLCADPLKPGETRAPEMAASILDAQIFYNRTIAVPIARNVDQPAVRRGAQRFVDTGCAACHTTTQHSGDSDVAGLAHLTFHPFTDLLLHDMGEGLADHRPEFDASGTEWRTPPLWGLSRRIEVYGYPSMLHDGRARTAEEAILWHAGEATIAKNHFMQLDKASRDDLVAFLGSI